MEQKTFEPKDLIVPADFENRWVPELTDDDYHADKTAVGSGALREALQSPNAFFEGQFLGKRKADTNDMRLGRIIHMAFLEPDKFQERYIVEPVFQGRTQKGELTTSLNCKEVREKREAWLADRPPGQIVVTEEELEQINGMVAAAKRHPQGEHIFAKGVCERAGYYRDPRTGILMKIKPDFRAHDMFMVTDFKSCVDSSERPFGAVIFGKRRLDVQIWMYAFGSSLIENCNMPEHLFFLAIEKKWPYEAAGYYLTEEQRAHAQYSYNQALDRIMKGIETGLWPQRQAKIQPAYTPKFFIDEDVMLQERELEDAESAAVQ